MNRCWLLVSANASRLKPGVSVPFAAPSDAAEPASFASCCSDLPDDEGNWLATGRCAAASSSTAGAGPAVAVVVELELAVALDGLPELCVAELPQAPRASATTTTPRRRTTVATTG